MNLALTDPFILAQDCPEALTGKLSKSQSTHSLAPADFLSQGSGHATCLRFNRKGDFLASGRVRFLQVHPGHRLLYFYTGRWDYCDIRY